VLLAIVLPTVAYRVAHATTIFSRRTGAPIQRIEYFSAQGILSRIEKHLREPHELKSFLYFLQGEGSAAIIAIQTKTKSRFHPTTM
jgi:hypothetical protein